MTTKQLSAIKRRTAWMLGSFTPEDIEKCSQAVETSLSSRDAFVLLDLLVKVETWQSELDAPKEAYQHWIESAKKIIATIK